MSLKYEFYRWFEGAFHDPMTLVYLVGIVCVATLAILMWLAYDVSDKIKKLFRRRR